MASEDSGEPDVVIDRGQIEGMALDRTNMGPCLYATAEEVCLFWEGRGTFVIRGGREIIVDPASGSTEDIVRLFIVSSVFGVVLHQRGLLVLHASAVAVNGQSVAFVGEAGRGKSTLAALLHQQGCAMVADDIIGVRFDSSGPTVYPGFPQFRLWPDTLSAMGLAPDLLPKVHPLRDKRGLIIHDGLSTTALSLRRVYVINESETLGIEPLGPQEAFLQLMRHSHCKGLVSATGQGGHFLNCTALGKTGIVHRLNIPRSFHVIPELIAKLEEDVNETPFCCEKKLAAV